MLLFTVLAEAEQLKPLIMPPLAFGGIALGAFFVLGFITFTYRDVANRRPRKSSNSHDSHGADH
jgi:uncharacterized protein (DUF2062 family)